MTNPPLRSPIPLWLRVVIVVAILGFVWMSQRQAATTNTESPVAKPQPVEPTPVTVEVVARETVPPIDLAKNETEPEAPLREAQAVTPTPVTQPPKTTSPAKTTSPPPTQPKPAVKKTDDFAGGKSKSLVITNLKLKDQSGRIIFQGDVDLQPTLDRIAEGKLLDRFPHDGSTFQNRERKLPRQPSGYYKEYVVPTPGQNGPGPQRLVIGKDDETYYTHDHYKTFRRVR